MGPLLERIGDSSVVLLGEATHGTVGVLRGARPHHPRADDAQGVHRGGRRGRLARRRPDRRLRAPRPPSPPPFEPFTRFPTWMWRNREVGDWSTGCATTTPRGRSAGPGQLPRAGPLQPLHLARRRPRLPRRRRPDAPPRSPVAATAASARGNRTRRSTGRRWSAVGSKAVRTTSWPRSPTCSSSAWPTPRATRSPSSRPPRTPRWSPTPSATTG